MSGDWSSDLCSSDLSMKSSLPQAISGRPAPRTGRAGRSARGRQQQRRLVIGCQALQPDLLAVAIDDRDGPAGGSRASVCRLPGHRPRDKKCRGGRAHQLAGRPAPNDSWEITAGRLTAATVESGGDGGVYVPSSIQLRKCPEVVLRPNWPLRVPRNRRPHSSGSSRWRSSAGSLRRAGRRVGPRRPQGCRWWRG